MKVSIQPLKEETARHTTSVRDVASKVNELVEHVSPAKKKRTVSKKKVVAKKRKK